jgi:hypothetical protein
MPNRSLNRHLGRSTVRYQTRVLPGTRRPNYLREACRVIGDYVRWRTRVAKQDPEIWGPCALQFQLAKLEEQKRQAEFDLALQRIYGVSADELEAASSQSIESVWKRSGFGSVATNVEVL